MVLVRRKAWLFFLTFLAGCHSAANGKGQFLHFYARPTSGAIDPNALVPREAHETNRLAKSEPAVSHSDGVKIRAAKDVVQARPLPAVSDDEIQRVRAAGKAPVTPADAGPAPPAPFGVATAAQALDKLPPEKREPVVEALHAILEGHHNEALTQLAKYDKVTQELFLRLLPPIAQLSKKPLEKLSAAEVAVLHDQLVNLLTLIRPRTELTIEKMCCCERVDDFGRYKPLPEGHIFHAATTSGLGDRVQLYVELRNFSSENRGDFYETRLATTLEICDARGAQLWFHRLDDEKRPIRSRALLNDYSNNYIFLVPHLPSGTHTLTLQIADETRPECRRVARKSIEFRVTAAGR